MGRLQYLERLALGRSAFRDPTTSPRSSGEDDYGQETPTSPRDENNARTQVYDDKGRPINKRTEERNAAMRNAQNAVLVLVGVVESKDASDKFDQAKNRTLRKQWEQLLASEQERGDDLNIAVEYLHRLLTWWPEALIARIQAGIYRSQDSFWDILMYDYSRLRAPGFAVYCTVFLPGVLPHALCTTLEAVLCSTLVEGIGQVQIYIGKRTKGRRAPKWLHITGIVVSEVLCAAVGAALMPLEFYAETQRLGLAPAWPLLPHWRTFIPSDPSSSHRYLWTPSVALARFGILGSPGPWLLVQRSLIRYQDEETPIGGQFTDFEYPRINEAAFLPMRMNTQIDPVAWLLYQGCIVRFKALRWLGWNLQEARRLDSPYENNRLQSKVDDKVRADASTVSGSSDDIALHGAFRSTSLSMQFAKFVGERIDHLLQKLLMLPLEGVVLRVVTQSFLATSLPKTSLAVTAVQIAYTPFGGGPIGRLMAGTSSFASWNNAGRYASKLGLGLALYCSTEVLISFMIYKTYRSQGIRNYQWAKPDQPSPTPETLRIEDERAQPLLSDMIDTNNTLI